MLLTVLTIMVGILLANGLFFLAPSTLHATDIAIFVALEADLRTLEAESKPAGQPVKVGDRTIYRLEVGKHRVYATKMGSGAVETAISATTMLTRFRCDLALSIGPVGSLDDALSIGTWHKVGRVLGYQKGTWTPTGFESAVESGYSDRAECQKWHEQLHPPALLQVDEITIASGETFVASSNYRQQLRAITKAQAVDMNLFGLENACKSQKTPLFSWRIVSDYANDQAGDNFRMFVADYGGQGGRALAELIRLLPSNPSTPESYPALRQLLEDSAKASPSTDPTSKLFPNRTP